MRGNDWTDRWIPGQRSVFMAVWTAFVKQSLGELNRAIAPGRPRALADIPKVGPMRAAAVFAAAWLDEPARLARETEPADDAERNRNAIRTILVLILVRGRVLPWKLRRAWRELVVGMQPAVAHRLRAVPAAGYPQVADAARRYGLSDGGNLAAFGAEAAKRGLQVLPEADQPWIPRNAANWFGPRCRLASQPAHERMHALVDAFFHDEYWRLHPDRPSPVQLLKTFPPFHLVEPPVQANDTADFERECAARNVMWHQRFVGGLADYPQISIASKALRTSQQLMRGMCSSPPLSADVPVGQAVMVLLEDYLADAECTEPALLDAGKRAAAQVAAVQSRSPIGQVATAVLNWVAAGRPDDGRAELTELLAGLGSNDRYLVCVLCHDAIAASMPTGKAVQDRP